MTKAIFLDKDGTLIPDIPYNVDPEKITLSENCIDGLRSLVDEGYLLIIVSNQSGIARGYFTEEQFGEVIIKMSSLMQDQSLKLTDFYYCPHHPEGIITAYSKDCNCRKPMPGMLQIAAQQLLLDLSECWMIGDILNDVEAGNTAGCKTVLIDNGNETEWLSGPYREPTLTCQSINEAAKYILEQTLTNVGLEQR